MKPILTSSNPDTGMGGVGMHFLLWITTKALPWHIPEN